MEAAILSAPKASKSRPQTIEESLGIDFNFEREALKEALLAYEDANPGNNLVGSKVYEFLRHVQNIVWKELLAIKNSSPEEYEKWRTGQNGYYPLKTNNTSHGTTLRLSEKRRMQNTEAPGEGYEGAKISKVSDNVRRTVQNWRKKTTATWIQQNGEVYKGFPFFIEWTRLNRKGEVDPKGRGNVVGYVNLQWIFGGDWCAVSENQKSDENQTVAGQQPEKFSTIPHYYKFTPKGEKIEGNVVLLRNDASGSALPMLPNKTAPQQGTVALETEKNKKKVAAAAKNAAEAAEPGPGGSADAQNALRIQDYAVRLWNHLMMVVYFPLLGTGRIRFGSDSPMNWTEFTESDFKKCLPMLVKNLHEARNADEISPKEAFDRLVEACDKQAEYLHKNGKAWVLVPDKFLKIDRAHGNLLSALRIFGSIDAPTPLIGREEDQNATTSQRRKRLYERLLAAGATRIHPGTWAKWYTQYGHEHLNACIDYMIGQAKRKQQQTGGLSGFEKNKGGASAYFASLVARFDSSALLKEAIADKRRATKHQLWQVAEEWKKDKSCEGWKELGVLVDKMQNDSQFYQLVIKQTQDYFGISIAEPYKVNTLILIYFVDINLNNQKQQ